MEHRTVLFASFPLISCAAALLVEPGLSLDD